ncbi:unnamed protein product [Candidula unifasciata]|uniref:Copper transport protein n=1 Tax=Candidula unifasciata TaxID=100452 RepID=A0A8S4A800_9EUPU|nr:unnamed protein product [Candidula unifasciata]
MTTAHNHSAVPDVGFYDWLNNIIHSTTGLPVMTLVVFVLAIFSEGLGSAIRRLRARPVFWIRSRTPTVILHNVLSTLVHASKVTLMFLLMVIFMALNVWLCLAAILGSALGYLVFNWSSLWESEAPDKEELAKSHW